MRVNPDNAPEKKEAYRKKLEAMTDQDLFKATKQMIWFSAYANNNPISCYHWQCDFTYNEWQRRKGDTGQYALAHKQVMAECGYGEE
jgi:hypothetical protein